MTLPRKHEVDTVVDPSGEPNGTDLHNNLAKTADSLRAGLTEHVRKIMNIPWSIYVDLIVRYCSIQCDKYIGKISMSAYVKTCVSHLITCAAVKKALPTARLFMATDLHGASKKAKEDTGDGCLGSPSGDPRWFF